MVRLVVITFIECAVFVLFVWAVCFTIGKEDKWERYMKFLADLSKEE
jgi:hypothetical protein